MIIYWHFKSRIIGTTLSALRSGLGLFYIGLYLILAINRGTSADFLVINVEFYLILAV